MKKTKLDVLYKWLIRTAMLSIGGLFILKGFIRLDKGCDITMFNDYYLGASGAWFFFTGGKFVLIGSVLLVVLWLSEKIDW